MDTHFSDSTTSLHPSTVSHLLSLPPVIQPISPSLSALHFARIRLQLSIPARSLKHTAWCSSCGALRDDQVGRKGAGGGSPSKRSRGNALKGTTAHASSENVGLAQIPTGDNPVGVTSPNASPIPASTRLGNRCHHCGEIYRRPKPLFDKQQFPNARRVRACRVSLQEIKAKAEVEANKGGEIKAEMGTYEDTDIVMRDSADSDEPQAANAGAVSVPSSIATAVAGLSAVASTSPPATVSVRTGHSAMSSSSSPPSSSGPLSRIDIDKPTPIRSTTPNTSSRITLKLPPKYTSNPSLAYVQTAAPNPPTYTQPAPKASSPPRSAGAKGASAGKKKKKSGLAKLLAENKEREAGRSFGSGSGWGLD